VPTECLPEEDCPSAEATIVALRSALTAAAEERWMPEPRKLFPRKWVAINEWLESLDKEGKNYLDYETFARECAARGEPDPQKQAEVAALMHDLGIAMNYAYAVAAQKPVEMLKAEDYPAEKWAFLLRLMNLFQLSFPLEENGTRQLCPALLQPEMPAWS
jgi:hypothetical protein